MERDGYNCGLSSLLAPAVCPVSDAPGASSAHQLGAFSPVLASVPHMVPGWSGPSLSSVHALDPLLASGPLLDPRPVGSLASVVPLPTSDPMMGPRPVGSSDSSASSSSPPGLPSYCPPFMADLLEFGPGAVNLSTDPMYRATFAPRIPYLDLPLTHRDLLRSTYAFFGMLPDVHTAPHQHADGKRTVGGC